MKRLGGFERDIAAHRDKALSDIDGYWHRLARHRVPPRRADIDPREIENALEYAFLLERLSPTQARFRVAGGHLRALAGHEVAGVPISLLFDVNARERFETVLERVFGGPAKAVLELRSRGGFGRPAMTARMALYPLLDERGRVTRALGTLGASGRIGRVPRRFGIEATDLMQLNRVERHNPVRARPGPCLRLVVNNA